MRQKPIGNYIVDFYCSKKKLVIEIDGESHGTSLSLENDIEKDDYLNSLGLHVLRIDDRDVKRNMNAVINKIIVRLET